MAHAGSRPRLRPHPSEVVAAHEAALEALLERLQSAVKNLVSLLHTLLAANRAAQRRQRHACERGRQRASQAACSTRVASLPVQRVSCKSDSAFHSAHSPLLQRLDVCRVLVAASGATHKRLLLQRDEVLRLQLIHSGLHCLCGVIRGQALAHSALLLRRVRRRHRSRTCCSCCTAGGRDITPRCCSRHEGAATRKTGRRRRLL